MLAFVTAVGRWFPELKPPEEVSDYKFFEIMFVRQSTVQEEIPCKEEEQLTEEQAIMESEKIPPPMPVQSVEAVLHR